VTDALARNRAGANFHETNTMERTMRKITLTTLALAALTTSAQAGWHHRYQVYRWTSPVYSYQPSAAVYSAEVPLSSDDEAARQERISKWEAFCRPVAHVDSLGVSRYSYAHENCDAGRSE
jgi:hypothetical protein